MMSKILSLQILVFLIYLPPHLQAASDDAILAEMDFQRMALASGRPYLDSVCAIIFHPEQDVEPPRPELIRTGFLAKKTPGGVSKILTCASNFFDKQFFEKDRWFEPRSISVTFSGDPSVERIHATRAYIMRDITHNTFGGMAVIEIDTDRLPDRCSPLACYTKPASPVAIGETIRAAWAGYAQFYIPLGLPSSEPIRIYGGEVMVTYAQSILENPPAIEYYFKNEVLPRSVGPTAADGRHPYKAPPTLIGLLPRAIADCLAQWFPCLKPIPPYFLGDIGNGCPLILPTTEGPKVIGMHCATIEKREGLWNTNRLYALYDRIDWTVASILCCPDGDPAARFITLVPPEDNCKTGRIHSNIL